MLTNGGVSLKDLLSMPSKQYVAFKKAVDIAEIERRKVYIHDTATAFSEPQKAIAELNKSLSELTKGKSSIIWDADSDAVQRAKDKYMR